MFTVAKLVYDALLPSILASHALPWYRCSSAPYRSTLSVEEEISPCSLNRQLHGVPPPHSSCLVEDGTATQVNWELHPLLGFFSSVQHDGINLDLLVQLLLQLLLDNRQCRPNFIS
mmetsp:Transcript_17474/g.37103  ORF Transcript_17474/g.37103 Transcript_17474/m.37103 type:complete len:116 (-) Transcript_17474:108-455(-)